MCTDHARKVERAFTTQAESFEDAGGPVTGFAPREDRDAPGSELWFTQTFASAIARRPAP